MQFAFAILILLFRKHKDRISICLYLFLCDSDDAAAGQSVVDHVVSL